MCVCDGIVLWAGKWQARCYGQAEPHCQSHLLCVHEMTGHQSKMGSRQEDECHDGGASGIVAMVRGLLFPGKMTECFSACGESGRICLCLCCVRATLSSVCAIDAFVCVPSVFIVYVVFTCVCLCIPV